MSGNSPSPMPYLILPNGRQIPVAQSYLTIGSDAVCDLRLTDTLIAPRHAIIQDDGRHWRVAKLNLNAVVWLNGRPLQAMTLLHDGDHLWVGETRMTWREQTDSGGGHTSLSGNARTLFYALFLLIAILFGLWSAWTVFSMRFVGNNISLSVYSSPPQGPDNASSLHTPPPLHTLVVPAPTATATPTLTPNPASTLATNNPISLPTATPTIKSASAKTSPPPTLSQTPTPPATPRPSPNPRHRKPTPTRAPTPCTSHPPHHWQQMTVQRGQTLSLLAQKYHTTVNRLKSVNCLSSDLIFAWQHLWAPALPTPTPRPT